MAAGGTGIRAGGAFVELFAEDGKLRRTLKQSEARIKAWGGSIKKIGTALFAAGAAGVAALGGMLGMASEIGGEMNDLAMKTGATAESLSLLKFAADQNGASLEMVGNGIKFMQKNLDAARNGSKGAIDAFGRLGVNFEDLAKLSPDEQFLRMADAIAQVEDPSERTALAMKVFGKAGSDLIPMLSQGSDKLREFMDTAKANGLQLSTKEVQALDDFGDAWSMVKEQATRAAIGIGGALAPILTDLAGQISEVMVRVINWIKENDECIVQFAEIAAGVMAAGAVLIGLGQTISMVGTVVGVFGSTLSFAVTHATQLGAALAVAGILIFAQQVYSANEAVRELNEQLGRAAGINSRFAKVKAREQRGILDEASQLEGDKKVAFLKEQKELAETDTAGLGHRIKDQEKKIEQYPDWKHATGNKLLAGDKDTLRELEQARNNADDFIDQLDRAIKDAERPKPSGGSIPKLPANDRAGGKIALPEIPDELQRPKSNPMGPLSPAEIAARDASPDGKAKIKAAQKKMLDAQRDRDRQREHAEREKQKQLKGDDRADRNLLARFDKATKSSSSTVGTFSSERLEGMGAGSGTLEDIKSLMAKQLRLLERRDRQGNPGQGVFS